MICLGPDWKTCCKSQQPQNPASKVIDVIYQAFSHLSFIFKLDSRLCFRHALPITSSLVFFFVIFASRSPALHPTSLSSQRCRGGISYNGEECVGPCAEIASTSERPGPFFSFSLAAFFIFVQLPISGFRVLLKPLYPRLLRIPTSNSAFQLAR